MAAWPLHLNKTRLSSDELNLNPISPTNTPMFALTVTAWGLIAGPKGRSCLGFMIKGTEEEDRDQSAAFKLIIISIKVLHDINPVSLLMCVGFGWWGSCLIMIERKGGGELGRRR